MATSEEKTCTICFCDGLVTDGVCCGEGHYTCGDCFEMYVKSEIEKPVGEIKKRDPEGRCLCPRNTASGGSDRCTAAPLSDKDVAANLSHTTFEGYLRSRAGIREAKVADAMRKEMEKRILLEKKRALDLASSAGSTEKLRAAKEQVVETILTLSCPRCHQAFVDFDGCFALNCGRCRAAFCAYCLADCGRDAHAHVGTCPEGAASLKASGTASKRVGGHPPTVYGNKNMFEVAQKRRRCKQLALFLEKYDENFRGTVLKELDRELKDLTITPGDIKKFGKANDKAIEKADKAAAAQRGRGGAGGRGGLGGAGPGPGGRGGDARAAMGRALEMAAHMFGGEDGRVHIALRAQLQRGGAGGRRGGAPAFDPLQELLDAGIGGPGMGLLPGENPEGEIGPLRRERLEKKRRAEEALEAAAKEKRDARVARRAAAARPKIVTKVDLVNLETSPADATGGSGGSGSGGSKRPRREPRGPNGTPNGNGDGAANGIAIDLASSQDLGLDGREYDFVFGSGAGGSKSPGRRNSGASSGKRGTDTAQAGGDAFVDLT